MDQFAPAVGSHAHHLKAACRYKLSFVLACNSLKTKHRL